MLRVGLIIAQKLVPLAIGDHYSNFFWMPQFWQLQFPDSKLSHEEFLNQVAMSLVLNPAGTGQKRPTKMEVIGSKGLEKLEHYWVKLDRWKYCQVCHIDRKRMPRREPLAEIDNFNIKGDGEVLRVIGAVQDVRIVYAVKIRAVGRLYMYRYQYIRAFRLLYNSIAQLG